MTTSDGPAAAGAPAADPATAAIPPAGVVLVALLILLWGANFTAMKLALSELPPLTFRAFCNMAGGCGLLAIAWCARDRSLRIPAGDMRPLLTAAFFNVTAWQLLLTFGLLEIEASDAAILAYTMPLWTVLFARLLLGERLTASRIVALTLGIGAVLVLNGEGPSLFDVSLFDVSLLDAPPRGALLVLGAAACWAIGTIVTKRHRWRLPTVTMTGWQVFLGGLPFLPAMVLFENPTAIGSVIAAAGAPALAGAVYAALVAMIVCHLLWFTLLGMLPASVAGISILAIPVVGVLISAAVLGERIGWRDMAALAMVVAALVLVLLLPAWQQYRGSRPPRS